MSRKASLLAVGGAIGCSLLLLCLFFGTLAAITYFSSGNGGPINRIAYVDSDNNIQVVDAHGEHRVALTTDASRTVPRVYLFPTWSPNSQHIAFVGLSGADTTTAALYSAPSGGGTPATVFKSTTQTPFYLYWSPDNQWIGFLAQTDAELSLMLGRGDGSAAARKLETGSPFYWAWSPDSRALFLHIGGSTRDPADARLALLGRDSTSPPQALQERSGKFRSAALFARWNQDPLRGNQWIIRRCFVSRRRARWKPSFDCNLPRFDRLRLVARWKKDRVPGHAGRCRTAEPRSDLGQRCRWEQSSTIDHRGRARVLLVARQPANCVLDVGAAGKQHFVYRRRLQCEHWIGRAVARKRLK